MSTTIDQRVVEMRFDNQHFERNVSTTMSTLDKLKQKLNLTGASKGLENIDASAKKVNMNGLGSAVEAVSAKFSALQVMGVTALANITNSAVNAGKSIVKSLTIDPIKTGFEEYETKMGSIQTILANTEHQGTTLNDVTAALEKLNLYADKTIYNFQQMTRNIGTFTAAGVDLDTSVKSIQGIANLAAVSGSTSQQASTAMYQLSQALASGTVKLQDWNSVVNAGMGGKVFQNALIRTAAMLDGSANDVAAWQAKNVDAFGSFRDSLTQGAWMTTEVLTKTLEQFTMAAEEGSDEWNEFKKSLMADGYTEAQAEEILKMANTATDAATKVKTFTQLLDTLKESAQSGWAQTWELLIGDFEEAKAFFTELSDLFGGIIGKSSTRRNNLLTEAMSSNWDKLISKINDAGIETEKFEESIRKVVGDSKLDELIAEYGSLEAAVRKGKISSDDLKKALDGIGGTSAGTKVAAFVDGLKEIERILGRGSVGEDVKKLQTALDGLGYDLGTPGIDGIIGPITEQAIKDFQAAEGLFVDGIAGPETIAALEKAGTKIEEIDGDVSDLTMSAGELIDELTKSSGRELLLGSLMNIIKAIQRPLAAIGEAFRNTFSITPTQLYNALEKLNKFTDKFVMKGLLDIDNWNSLIKTLEQLGISADEFKSAVEDALSESGVDVDKLIEKYGTLRSAFEKGAISAEVITDALLNLGLSESLINGGKNADRLRRAFEGLFAVFEIIGRVAGGGLRVAFDILTSVLGVFDMDVLDLVANMSDAIVAFRDWIVEGNLIAKMFDNLLAKLPGIVKQIQSWFDAFKQTPAIQKLVTAIEAVQSAFEDLTSGKIDVSEFARQLGTNLAKLLKSLPEIAIQIGKDFIAGFTNGIGDGISDVISNIINFCREFVSSFAEELGVQSPSWKAYDTASDFFQGFINGAQDAISGVISVLRKIGEEILKVFKSLWDAITDENGNIEWGKLFAGGAIIAMLWFIKQLATAFTGIAEGIGGLGNLLDNAGDAVKKFGKVLDAYSWDLKASALMKLAISIGILAASIWLLAQIDDPAKLWSAVGVIAVLAVIVVGLAFAMDKMSSASMKIDKDGAKFDGLKSGLVQIGLVLLLLAVTVKLLGSMDPDSAKQGFIRLAGLAVGLIIFMAALGGISRYSKDMRQFSSLLVKLSLAMMLMVIVLKLVGKLSAEEMLQGAVFVTAFTLFIAAIAKVTKNNDGQLSKLGGMMIALAIAMGLMVGVVKLVSTLSAEEMLQGAIFAAAFVLFIKALIWATKVDDGQKLAKVGGLVLAVSFSLMLMVGVCKLVGRLSTDEMVKGALFAFGFAVMVKAMISILSNGDGDQMAKVAGTILAISLAIGLLAAIAVVLSFVPLDGLAKGVAAVTILGIVMKGMIKALQGANEVKGSIMMMAIAIAVMAAAVIALSFVPFEDLAPAVAGLSILMAAFALMAKMSSGLKDVKVGSILAMIVVVAALAGVIYLLRDLDPLSAIGSAIALSTLMLAMVAVLQVLELVKSKLTDSLEGILALTLMAVPLLALVGVLALMSGVQNATANAIALAGLATVLTVLLIPLTIIGAIASTGAGAVAIGLGIVALLAMAVPLLALVGVLALMSCVSNATANATLLIALVTVLTDVLMKLSLVAPLAIMGVSAMAGLTLLIGEIGVMALAIGVLMDKFPSIQKFLDTGLPVLEQLAGSIGKMIGSFIGGIGEGIGESLVKIGEDIAEFMDALSVASDNASGIKGDAFDGVASLIGVLVGIGATSVGTTIADIFTGIFGGQTTMEKFQSDAIEFFDAMKAIGEASSGVTVNAESIDSVIGIAEKISKLQSSLEPMGGVISFFTGRKDLAAFGENAGLFINSMITAFGSLNGVTVNTEALDPIISAAESLSTLQSSLEPIGGVISWFTGRDDLATFGLSVGAFINAMMTALSYLDGFTANTEALDPIISAAEALAGLQSSLEPIGGVISWFTGRDDLATFGLSVGAFILSMKGALAVLEGATLDEAALSSVIDAATKLADLQAKLDPMGGVVSWFTGRDDLGKFGTNVGQFGEALGMLKAGMGENGIGEDVVASVTNAGTAIIELQKALPEEGWFDGKMNLSEFSGYITDFGTAIGGFGEMAAGVDATAVGITIGIANRIKTLIESLVGLDTSGIETFTGVGSGGFGADGAAYKIAKSMSSYSEEVAGIDTMAVSTSVAAATTLKSLIGSLVGLDTSGIENFKVTDIGIAMRSYGDEVANTDLSIVTGSISAANMLRALISSLVGLDVSGIGNFNVVPIAAAISSYGTTIGAVKLSAISQSVAAANRLRDFISSLNGLDTGGVSSFKAAIDELRSVDVGNLAQTFSSAAVEMTAAMATLATAMITGVSNAAGSVVSAFGSLADEAVNAVTSKLASFTSAGNDLATAMGTGVTNKASSVTAAVSKIVSSATSSARSGYSGMYSAGAYVVDGFAKGISDHTWKVGSPAEALAKYAIKVVKETIDSNSPSKVFREIGTYVPQGFAIGIGSLNNLVGDSAADMANGAIDSVKGSIAKIANVINTDIDSQPTIRPVMDLSDVRSGAAAIGGLLSGNASIGVMANVGAISSMMNARGQNGGTNDIVAAINKLGKELGNTGNTTYSINGVTYDDGTNVATAVREIVRAARTERRV